MPQPSANTRTVRQLSAAIAIYEFLAFLYSMYGAITSQGIAGYFTARQMDWFGSASMVATVFLTLGVVAVIPFLLAVAIGMTVWEELGQACLALFIPPPKTEPSTQIQPLKKPSQPLTWGTVGKTTGILLALTGATAGMLYLWNVREQAKGVYQLDLDGATASLPGGVSAVQVTGRVARPYFTGYRENRTLHVFAPVTPSNWTAGQPVQYFIHYQQYNMYDQKAPILLPTELRESGRTVLEGRVGGRLPVFAERDFTKKGLKVAPRYHIVDWQRVTSGEVPMGDSHIFALVIGLAITLSAFAVMAAAKRSQRKQSST